MPAAAGAGRPRGAARTPTQRPLVRLRHAARRHVRLLEHAGRRPTRSREGGAARAIVWRRLAPHGSGVIAAGRRRGPARRRSTTSTASGSPSTARRRRAELVDAMLGGLRVKVRSRTHAAGHQAFEDLVLDLPPRADAGVAETTPAAARTLRTSPSSATPAGRPAACCARCCRSTTSSGTSSYLFFSDEHGFSKPDVRVFRHTLEAARRPRRTRRPTSATSSAPTSPGPRPPAWRAAHFVAVNDHDLPHSTADLIAHRFDELPGAARRAHVPGVLSGGGPHRRAALMALIAGLAAFAAVATIAAWAAGPRVWTWPSTERSPRAAHRR